MTDPCVLPVAEGVETTSIFTVSDPLVASNGYEMTGIPDRCLGAVVQGSNLIVYMNPREGGPDAGGAGTFALPGGPA